MKKEKKLKILKIITIITLCSIMIFFYVMHFFKVKAEELRAISLNDYEITNTTNVSMRNYGLGSTTLDNYVLNNDNSFSLLLADSVPFSWTSINVKIDYTYYVDFETDTFSYTLNNIVFNNSFVPSSINVFYPRLNTMDSYTLGTKLTFPIDYNHEVIRFIYKGVTFVCGSELAIQIDDFNEDSKLLPISYGNDENGQYVNFISTQDDSTDNLKIFNLISYNNPTIERYFNISDIIYNEYYQIIYDSGYDDGYIRGQDDGYIKGYDQGFDDGSPDEEGTPKLFKSMLLAIMEYPINFFKNVFNFDLFGINIASAVLGIITLLIVVFVIKKLF